MGLPCPGVHALRDTHMTTILFQLLRRVPMSDKPVVFVDMVLPRLQNNRNAGCCHACGVQPHAPATARTLNVP